MRHSLLRHSLHAAARATLLATALLGAAACRASTRAERDTAICRQTYEFGNHGCARVLAEVEGPAAPLPPAYRYDVRAVPARSNAGGLGSAHTETPRAGANQLEFILYTPLLPLTADTLSVWVVGRLLDQSQPLPPSGILPIFAADSVLRVLRFAPVGANAFVDTVHLTLRRVP